MPASGTQLEIPKKNEIKRQCQFLQPYLVVVWLLIDFLAAVILHICTTRWQNIVILKFTIKPDGHAPMGVSG